MEQFKELAGKNVLVTGGAGFVGSHICEALLSHGAKVVCFDDMSTGSEGNVEIFTNNPNYSFVKGDANNLEDLEKVFADNKFDYVFHYAARVGVKRTVEKPLEVLRDIDGIKYILELSHKSGVEKVMFSSSSEVYGEPVEIPEKEDGHLNAKLDYAVVKLVGENYLKAYYKTHGLKTCSLRFFNVFGSRQDASSYGFVTGIFIKQIMAGKPVTVFGDGTQTRDFVFVKDNINASLLALLSDKTNGEVLNIGVGRPRTILSLAEIIGSVLDKEVQIEHLPLRSEGEILHRFPDVTKMRELLGYEPQFTIEEGLKETCDWYKDK